MGLVSRIKCAHFIFLYFLGVNTMKAGYHVYAEFMGVEVGASAKATIDGAAISLKVFTYNSLKFNGIWAPFFIAPRKSNISNWYTFWFIICCYIVGAFLTGNLILKIMMDEQTENKMNEDYRILRIRLSSYLNPG